MLPPVAILSTGPISSASTRTGSNRSSWRSTSAVAGSYSELTIKDREWVCPNCGSVIDRDYNAALNIRDEGMRILSGGGSPSDGKQKRAEAAA